MPKPRAGPDLELAVVEKYCELVKRKGEYKYVCALPVMNPDLDTFKFWLIYGTRHLKGVQKFKEAEKRTEKMTHIVRANAQQRTRELRSGNRELFAPDVQYQENRYQQLSTKNRLRVKIAMWELIEVRGVVDYDDCWAEALQMSAVYETDLRGWIREWEEQGFVEVEGRLSPRTGGPRLTGTTTTGCPIFATVLSSIRWAFALRANRFLFLMMEKG